MAGASHLDPLLLAGIMAQESRFHADVQSCHAGGCDLGVAQVNWETWARELELDRHRLIHDDAYNLAVAATILTDLRVRFRSEGRSWWTRYHDAAPGPPRRLRRAGPQPRAGAAGEPVARPRGQERPGGSPAGLRAARRRPR